MAGLKAMFSMNAVQNFMESQIEAYDQKVIGALQYEGNDFVTKARENHTYTDDTGNLTSSIGYVILKDGNVIDSDFRGKGADGISEGKRVADEVGAEYPKGFVLIGVAGMSYAAAVESKGYDVITGSAPESADLKDLLGAIKL